MANRLRGRYGYPADEPFRVTVHPDRLREPYRWRKPKRVFVCSMGDLFHEDVPARFIDTVFEVMSERTPHTFQILTKRAVRMAEFIRWHYEHYAGRFAAIFPNVQCGVSACNQTEADANIPELLRTPAAVRFVSFEPLLSAVNIERYVIPQYSELFRDAEFAPVDRDDYRYNALDWVIVGCESGPGHRPCKLEWVESIVAQCGEASVPVFVKQIEVDGRISHDPNEWPAHLRVREYPR